ncbi:hypothetical protein CALCODRAFT_336596 [Calocera cornea HHB12733]|uniref:Uncharacterized protein n=1 Tax=Calocera cornea HHB12733 TaxID=1353952 RepID=A0A165F0Q5_9BASI|nr:hypothetical protein CALCODRAFT_336596 [Calocera cornea HHB12733]
MGAGSGRRAAGNLTVLPCWPLGILLRGQKTTARSVARPLDLVVTQLGPHYSLHTTCFEKVQLDDMARSFPREPLQCDAVARFGLRKTTTNDLLPSMPATRAYSVSLPEVVARRQWRGVQSRLAHLMHRCPCRRTGTTHSGHS